MSTSDITANALSWNRYNGKEPEQVIESIYADISVTSRLMCNWYWSSIRTKRWTSLIARGLAFLFLLIGITLPLLAALGEVAEDKLLLTQFSVASLVIAGLIQFADRIFGWSTGWMRYIATVTEMENLIRVFQTEWNKFLASRTVTLNVEDAHILFELAKGLEQELIKRQTDETTKWAVEFNAGIALLDTLVKAQREETEKKLESIQSAQTLVKANDVSGALEVNLIFNAGISAVKIGLDKYTPVDFYGNSWAVVDVTPGLHTVRVITSSQAPWTIERIAEVKPGSLTRLDIVVGGSVDGA